MHPSIEDVSGVTEAERSQVDSGQSLRDLGIGLLGALECLTQQPFGFRCLGSASQEQSAQTGQGGLRAPKGPRQGQLLVDGREIVLHPGDPCLQKVSLGRFGRRLQPSFQRFRCVVWPSHGQRQEDDSLVSTDKCVSVQPDPEPGRTRQNEQQDARDRHKPTAGQSHCERVWWRHPTHQSFRVLRLFHSTQLKMAFLETVGKRQSGWEPRADRFTHTLARQFTSIRLSAPATTFNRLFRSLKQLSMNSRTRNRILIVAAVVLSIGGIAAFFGRPAIAPTPSLEEIRALARVRQFDRARVLLQRYLVDNRQSARAHLLMADLATEPTSPNPALALEHLRAIRPESPRQAALVKFFEGKARHQQGRFDLAEACWIEAVRLDPLVPEAGWVLIDLLDRESRTEEAHRLGMRLHEIEPDPRDRVRILLEMSRLDIEAPEPLYQVQLFGSLVKEHPEALPISLTVGLALIRANRGDEGLAHLQDVLGRRPDSPETWDIWLTGLYEAADFERLAVEFARLPKSLATDRRFAKHEAMIAQNARDWAAAVRAYRRAVEFEPYNNGVRYRLAFVLRQAGETSESERMDRDFKAYNEAFKQLRGSYFEKADRQEDPDVLAKDFKETRGAYLEAVAIKSLGVQPHTELYQRLADLREKMGRFDEARAWHRLVVRDFPDNAISLAALERLK